MWSQTNTAWEPPKKLRWNQRRGGQWGDSGEQRYYSGLPRHCPDLLCGRGGGLVGGKSASRTRKDQISSVFLPMEAHRWSVYVILAWWHKTECQRAVVLQGFSCFLNSGQRVTPAPSELLGSQGPGHTSYGLAPAGSHLVSVHFSLFGELNWEIQQVCGCACMYVCRMPLPIDLKFSINTATLYHEHCPRTKPPPPPLSLFTYTVFCFMATPYFFSNAVLYILSF